ncbi:MAG TPA: hypothetical protein VH561_12910 [Micromonosporaceae bacterium]|jgi:hypothetical protein
MVTARSIAAPQEMPYTMLDGLRFAIPSTGVVLGRDAAGNAVQASLFAPGATTVTYIGGWWAVQLIVLRCLAIGAVLQIDAIDTDTPARAGALAGLHEWLALARPVGGGAQPATPDRPVLHVRDLGPSGPTEAPPPAPWQTTLTVLSRVTPANHDIVEAADVVLSQRLDPREAAVVASARLLTPEFAREVGAMDNETIAASRPRAVRYVRLCPTTVERQLFG